MNQINPPAHIKVLSRAAKLAADDFWAFHRELSDRKGTGCPKEIKRYELLRRRMITARDRRSEAVRQFTLSA
jgi:hypothetical protein